MKRWCTTILLLLVVAAWATGNPKIGMHRFQDKAGMGSVDTLKWLNDPGDTTSDGENISLAKDTLSGTTPDTTTAELEIGGCSYVAVWIAQSTIRSPAYYSTRYVFQVSPDLNNWLSLATFFTITSTQNQAVTFARRDTVIFVVYNQDVAAQDTVISVGLTSTQVKGARGQDMRKVKGARYLRIIAAGVTPAAASDSLIVRAIAVREWPTVQVQ